MWILAYRPVGSHAAVNFYGYVHGLDRHFFGGDSHFCAYCEKHGLRSAVVRHVVLHLPATIVHNAAVCLRSFVEMVLHLKG